jgi:hypothetical protein
MNLKKIIMNCTNNVRYAEQIIIDERPSMRSKDFINQIIARNKWCIRELELKVSPELAQMIKKEISENDESTSFQNVIDMMALMDDDDRLKLEDYANEILQSKNK